jgi:hypothetical protein
MSVCVCVCVSVCVRERQRSVKVGEVVTDPIFWGRRETMFLL